MMDSLSYEMFKGPYLLYLLSLDVEQLEEDRGLLSPPAAWLPGLSGVENLPHILTGPAGFGTEHQCWSCRPSSADVTGVCREEDET